jgi:hypothetical protein
MPTPDLSGYVDLAPYDRSPADVIARALLDATTKLPGWTPREGNTEVVLIEALALEVAELIYAINRVPSAVTMQLLSLFGVLRDDGTPPVATVTFTVLDASGYTIPAGTIVRVDAGGETGYLTFTLDTDLNIAAGLTSGTGAVTGTRSTAEANGVPAGTTVELVSSVYFVEAAVLATPVADGVDPEDDLAWLDRGVNRLSRLVTTLVLPEHFTAAALEEADVVRATTLDNYDGVGANTSTDYGHVTVAVYGDGAALSAPRKAEIEAALEELAVANLDVHVIDPTINSVEVDVTVLRQAGYDSADVEAAVDAALDAYLDPASWEWAGTVYLNELIALIDAVAGVDRVTALTIAGAAADYVLTGVAPLADYNTAASVTTVTAP